MALYNMYAVNTAATTVTTRNLFTDFREVQLFAMSLLVAAEKLSNDAPPEDRFDSRVVREGIPAGMQTRLTPVAVLKEVHNKDGSISSVYQYEYEETQEIIDIGV